MSKTPLVLHHSPHACSQVAVCALEQAGLEYRLNLVDLSVNAQSEPAYLALSPLGKVPALEAEGAVVTENAAILVYIAARAPEAGLFPASETPLALSERQAALSFCGGTLHPMVRGLAAPQRLTDGDVTGVRSRSTALALKTFAVADRRLAERGWWLGEESIVDVYLNWALQTARRGGFDLDAFPALAGLQPRLTARPAFTSMMRIEQAATATLEACRAAA